MDDIQHDLNPRREYATPTRPETNQSRSKAQAGRVSFRPARVQPRACVIVSSTGVPSMVPSMVPRHVC